MELQEFIQDFDFKVTDAISLNPATKEILEKANNYESHLHYITCFVSFNYKLQKPIFIDNLKRQDLNLAIDAIYNKVEQELERLKLAIAIKQESLLSTMPVFMEARINSLIIRAN